jgi:hypothetical protein
MWWIFNLNFGVQHLAFELNGQHVWVVHQNLETPCCHHLWLKMCCYYWLTNEKPIQKLKPKNLYNSNSHFILFPSFRFVLCFVFLVFGISCSWKSMNYVCFCHNPTLREVWGRHSHSQKWDLRVLRDSWELRVRLQGWKHLALRCSLYRWKGLEV